MTSGRDEIAQKPLSSAATKQARDRTTIYATSLIQAAKTLAYHEQADTVSASHIEAAHASLVPRPERRSWFSEWGKVIGGTMFGTFLPGFITEINGPPPVDTFLISLYTALGIVGILIFAIALRK